MPYLPVRRPEAPYDPAYYVPRSDPRREDLEDQILEDLDSLGAVFLCGASGSGKTHLWQNILDRLERTIDGGPRRIVVRMDLRAPIQNSGKDRRPLLAEIIAHVARKLDIPADFVSSSSKRGPLDWTFELTRWLEKRVLPREDLRLVLAFDCPVASEGSPLQQELYQRVCSWPEVFPMSSSRERTRKLAVLVAHTSACSDREDFIDKLRP